MAVHTNTIYGHVSARVENACRQNIGLQQLLELLPTNRTLAAATTQPVSPHFFRRAPYFLKQAEVALDAILPQHPRSTRYPHSCTTRVTHAVPRGGCVLAESHTSYRRSLARRSLPAAWPPLAGQSYPRTLASQLGADPRRPSQSRRTQRATRSTGAV